jgi:hypothetical protein
MRIFYSIICVSESDAGTILDYVLQQASKAAGAHTANCVVRTAYDAAASTWRIDLMSSSFTPESVGACWDVLIDVHVTFPRDVWLGTYDEATIRRVAPTRLLILGDDAGYVVRPREFDALQDLRAT